MPNFYLFMGGSAFALKHIILVATARVYYHCHYVGDTVVGGCLGLFLAYLFYNLETHVMANYVVRQILNFI